MASTSSIHRAVAATALLALIVMGSGLAPAGPPADRTEQRWLERLPAQDRGFLDELLNCAPPAFASELAWYETSDGGPLRWEDLRGRVVVVQSWDTRSSKGRRAPVTMTKVLSDFSADDVQRIALHVPTAADNIKVYLDRKPQGMPVVVDAKGGFCNELGIYKRPTNVVVDRNGTVRYAGLTPQGLAAAVGKLVAEPHDPDAEPTPARVGGAPISEKGIFPRYTGTVGSARDVRGQESPELTITNWISDEPALGGRVVIVDFWATWCGPCVASIPHMNELAERFSSEAVVIGLSDEPVQTLEAFQAKNVMHYPMATDPSGAMKKSLAITGIPHAIVVSDDGIVRWQGHPASLNAETLGQIVAANRGGSGSTARNRWR